MTTWKWVFETWGQQVYGNMKNRKETEDRRREILWKQRTRGRIRNKTVRVERSGLGVYRLQFIPERPLCRNFPHFPFPRWVLHNVEWCPSVRTATQSDHRSTRTSPLSLCFNPSLVPPLPPVCLTSWVGRLPSCRFVRGAFTVDKQFGCKPQNKFQVFKILLRLAIH
jgi:hypothetical protein